MGVERLYLLPFGQRWPAFSDRDFVKRRPGGGLGVRHVAVGFDVTFGKGRTGDPESMRRYGEEFGFSVSVAEAVGDGPEDLLHRHPRGPARREPEQGRRAARPAVRHRGRGAEGPQLGRRDYRETVFLPDTPFPMRAGLPTAGAGNPPNGLGDLYAAIARRARPPARRSMCCTTARPTPTAPSTSATR
jgi:hypothetical protein